VLVIADDLGYGDAGFCGGDLATPRLDALAAESLVLDRFYAAPMCTPARAQLMTGKHAVHLGIYQNFKPDSRAGLAPGETTLAARLSEAGYRTALVGKWHLGHARKGQRPGARGFDTSYGHLAGWIDYFTHEVEGRLDWHRDGERLDETGYATDLIAAEAVRVIEEHDARQPLFLVVAFNAPHAPLQAPGDEAGRGPRRTYAAMVESLDRGVGEVARALEVAGLADETLLWFLSDNGANPKYGGSNGELAGGKYTCREGGVRVPSFLRWPGRIEPGRTSTFVGVVDLAPTLEAQAGQPPRSEADGVDVLGTLPAGDRPAARPLLFAVDRDKVRRRAVLRPPWKLIEERRDDGVTRRLFDVLADPREERDLAEERAGLVAELAELLP